MPRMSPAAAMIPPAPQVRLEPPATLGAEAAALWRTIVESLPPSWFSTSSVPLLETYCQHTIIARHIMAEIDAALACGDLGSELTGKLLRMHVAQSERLAALAIRLRLNPLSDRAPQQLRNELKAHTPGPKPWENWRGGRERVATDA